MVGARSKTKEFRNAEVGLVRLFHTDLWLGPQQGPRMVTYTPADDESRQRIEKLYDLACAASSVAVRP